MVQGPEKYVLRKHENNCAKGVWETWPETARPTRECQVQFLVMGVLTLAKL
jgi:hypothetical protein